MQTSHTGPAHALLPLPPVQGTTEVGCGLAQCPQGGLVACFYRPPGNVAGQSASNV